MLTDPGSAYAPSTRGKGAFAITDQLAFNMVLEQGISPIKSSEGDWRVVHAMNGTLRLMPLPALLFTNGHVFFYQHLPALHETQVHPAATLPDLASARTFRQINVHSDRSTWLYAS